MSQKPLSLDECIEVGYNMLLHGQIIRLKVFHGGKKVIDIDCLSKVDSRYRAIDSSPMVRDKVLGGKKRGWLHG